MLRISTHEVQVFLFLLLCLPSLSLGWSRSVNLEKELSEAKMVAQVKIISYARGQLKFTVIRKPKHPYTARYASPQDSGVLEFLTAQQLADPKFPGTMTSTWPAVGTEVLLVVDAKQKVSLFAARRGRILRFWSPLESDEVPIFKCEPPAMTIPTETHDNERHLSHEGCLYPAHVLTEKLPDDKLK